MCKRTILSYERHHVGDRRDRHQIEQPLFPTLGNIHKALDATRFAGAQCRLYEFERDGRTAQMRERVRRDLGIKYRDGRRKLGLDFVVVGHDHINSPSFCISHRFNSGRPHVDRDDEPHLALCELFDRRGVKAVAFSIAVRYVDLHILIGDLFEEIRKDRSARNAITVEIRIDRDAFIALDRCKQPIYRHIHIMKKLRCVRMRRVIRRKECSNIGRFHDAALAKQVEHKFTDDCFLHYQLSVANTGCDKLFT